MTTLDADRFFTGRCLWICFVVTVALALGAQAAAAGECRRETPLPADIRLMPAGPDVPETVARFAGAWTGAWKTPTGADALCHTLVVLERLCSCHLQPRDRRGQEDPPAAVLARHRPDRRRRAPLPAADG